MTSLIVVLLLMTALDARAQILPDRFVVWDPLAYRTPDTLGFSWMTSTHLFAEFARYLDNGDTTHGWNAGTGGFAEVARWDSTASIAMIGMTEVIMDPQNDIGFNPRAIFWEEGVLVSLRVERDASLQFGYVHRCKHDIDNLFPPQQRTLIYSGVVTRMLWRPSTIAEGSVNVRGGLAVRNDFFVHLLDDRPSSQQARDAGGSIERLIDAANISGRIDITPVGSRFRFYASGTFMMSIVGAQPGFSDRFDDIVVLGSLPSLELGAELFNAHGSAFTLFVRGEWQRDAGIHPTPQAASMASIGLRVSSVDVMW